MIKLSSPYSDSPVYVNYWDIVAIVPDKKMASVVLRHQQLPLGCIETTEQVFELMEKERERINQLCNAKRES